MPRKRAPGAGRKPADRAGPKTEAILARVHPDLKRRIELAAQAAGNKSMSSEIVRLLELGLKAREDARRAGPMRALCYLIEKMADACGVFADADGKPSWLTDPFVSRAFKLAVGQLLDWLEPKGKIVSMVDRVPKETFQGAPSGIVDSFRTPEARAQAVAQFIWSSMKTPASADDWEMARNWEPHGVRMERFYYGMEDVRRDLKELVERGERQ